MEPDIFNSRHIKMVGRLLKGIMAVLFFNVAPVVIKAQAVTEIITDYNGFWKTETAAINTVKPDNHHNLLSFTYNSTRYSTGVNDALLTSNGQTFTPGQYNALPMQNFNGTITGNTKIGLGAMVDGVFNGPGPAPSRTLGPYLNDGTNGLDMGTCIANIPAGTMMLSVSNVQAAKIGDGVPDIVVTQIADPSTSYDTYEFTDINGVRIGNSLNVVLNTISPVGNWVADFYEATGATILSAGFTQTQRAIRLWAADFSSFGINAGNIAGIAYFKITLSGASDIAFVAYNTSSISVQNGVLGLPQDLLNRQRISRSPRSGEIKSLAVYPNPAGRFVNFSHPQAKSGDKISLYNMSGIMIMQLRPSPTNNTRLDIPSLLPGIYQAVYTSGQKKFTEKFIVK